MDPYLLVRLASVRIEDAARAIAELDVLVADLEVAVALGYAAVDAARRAGR